MTSLFKELNQTIMYEFLTKRGQMIAFLVGVVLVAVHIMSGEGGVDFGLSASYGLTALAFLAMLVGIAKYFAENPKQIKVLLGFVVLFAFVGVMIMISSGTAPAALTGTVEKEGITPGVFKYVNGGINATMILLVLAFVGLIVSEVSSLFK